MPQSTRRPAGAAMQLLRRGVETKTNECVIFPPGRSRPTVWLGGRAMNASRAVWVLAHGDPGTSFVLHTCHRGVEGCINLRHLYLGDQARNIRDMYAVGRNGTPDRTGEANPRRKLTEREVEEIRQRYRAGGVRQVDLAEEYGVSQNNVSCIVRGENWVPEGATRRTAAMRRKRPSTETVEAVRARWAQGDVSQAAVAAEFGIGQTTVSRIVRGVR